MKKPFPETSREAYDSLNSIELAVIYVKIIEALKVLGSATSEQVATHLTMDHSKIWKRYSELERMNKIRKTGYKLRNKSGRSAFSYCLCDSNLPKTDRAEKAMKGPSIADYSREINKISKASQTEMF